VFRDAGNVRVEQVYRIDDQRPRYPCDVPDRQPPIGGVAAADLADPRDDGIGQRARQNEGRETNGGQFQQVV
jgi:hypothetical protein